MVKAVFLFSDKIQNIKEVENSLIQFGINNSSFKILQDSENQIIAKELVSSLQFSIHYRPPPLGRLGSAPKTNFDIIKYLFHSNNQIIFIDNSKTLIPILEDLSKSEKYNQIETFGYVLYESNNTLTVKNLKENFSIKSEEEIDEDFDFESEFQKKSNQSVIRFFFEYFKNRKNNFSKSANNIIEAKLQVSELEKNLQKLIKIINIETESKRKFEENSSIEELNLIVQRIQGKVSQNLANLNDLYNKTRKIPLKIDLRKIELPLSEFNTNMITLTEEQSENHEKHVFTIKNNEGRDFTDLKIYELDSNSVISTFCIRALEKITLSEDYLHENIKYQGLTAFQVFYCSFQISPKIEAVSILISDVKSKFQGSTIEIFFQSNTIATKDIKILNHNTILTSSFSVKNFQRGSISIDLKGFKGTSKIVMMSKLNKRISNEMEVIIN